tara:strand:+ start:339 stop:2510 length:2172 start_codon:yes stop_codon:yes gene_type:complete
MLITSTGKVLHYLIYIVTFIYLNPNMFGQSRVANKKQEKQYVNRLAKESSPYLLQHKNNPVDWYPWGDEAFQKALELNRPIFLSIGYSTCHWCHVMEEESFEDEQVAQLLNDNFISIKVDREERPEIDHLYMTVCQVMTGKGGWPLTIIMTPDKYPFFAGTYFPKKGRMGRPGMIELLPAISDAWVNKKDELIQSANQIKKYLIDSNNKELGDQLNQTILTTTNSQFINRYDKTHGGFGTKPKFPSPHNLIYLLRYHNMSGDKTSLLMVEKTLQEMRLGGIFDHVGFGFHRYSTDTEWILPHFEKMLYDQAMLTLAYTEAYQITYNQLYKDTAEEILYYVQRNMTDKRGGFYSAEDADSEGEEGLFYLWTIDEIKNILSNVESELLINTYGLNKEGNYDDEATGNRTEKNILYLKEPINNIELKNRLNQIIKKLYQARKKRIHPLKDDKILTDWNGLMIAAYAKAGDVFNSDDYIQQAEKSAQFILKNLTDNNGRLLKRYRNGNAGVDAHLDDYAFFIWGLLELYEATFNVTYLAEAIQLSNIMVDEFWDVTNGGFFLGGESSEKLIVRAKTGYDGAMPSGNSVAAMNCSKLNRITGETKWAEISDKIFITFSNEIQKTPSGYASMVNAFLFNTDNPKEIVIVGSGKDSDTISAIEKIKSEYVPNKVIIFKDTDDELNKLSPLAKWTVTQETIDEKTTYYICQDFACKIPTTDLDLALKFINE